MPLSLSQLQSCPTNSLSRNSSHIHGNACSSAAMHSASLRISHIECNLEFHTAMWRASYKTLCNRESDFRSSHKER